MIDLDANIVAVSLTSIARNLNADFAATEWVISAYTLAFASAAAAGWRASGSLRTQTIAVGRIDALTAASIRCGAAPTIVMLNVARAIQGAGAALLLSAALATLADAFRGHERSAAFAFWGTVIGVAMTIGPIVGGVITHRFGWPRAFCVNVPVGVVMFGLTVRAVRESRDPEAQSVDLGGALLFTVTLFCVTLALISVNHRGWHSPVVLNGLFGAFLLGVLFVWVEQRQTRPLLDFSYFRQSTLVGANVANLAYAATLLTC
jgi:MFS family permease